MKDVAKALAELISATKCAAGKAADDPSMFQLKSAAKVRLSKTLLHDINIILPFPHSLSCLKRTELGNKHSI